MTETSQPGRRGAEGVGGWLLLLCRLLVVFHPLSLAVTASGALSALSVRGTAVASILILRLVVVGFGMAAGRALQTVQPGAVTLATAALLASVATDVFVYTTPYFPNNRLPGDTVYYVIASLAYHGAWLAYLQRSGRVRATYADT
jgi:Ca2+/H+ antiporter